MDTEKKKRVIARKRKEERGKVKRWRESKREIKEREKR